MPDAKLDADIEVAKNEEVLSEEYPDKISAKLTKMLLKSYVEKAHVSVINEAYRNIKKACAARQTSHTIGCKDPAIREKVVEEFVGAGYSVDDSSENAILINWNK